ncbi:MAG: hypothetical protein DRI73_11610 [Bacteroidetes bacterium]|nr:MAG: hypothetical protein DRI73_11610 [Bacteroidota bacterium]
MEFLEILKYVLPSLIVFLASYLILKEMIKKEHSKDRFALMMQNQKVTLPVKMQAYERLTLFLERIAPDSLIIRTNKPGMTASQLHQGMLQAIRSEYNHNMSQQIYISHKAWELVKNARSSVIKLINTSADQVKPEDHALKLSSLILERLVKSNVHPTQVAIDNLRNELNQY